MVNVEFLMFKSPFKGNLIINTDLPDFPDEHFLRVNDPLR